MSSLSCSKNSLHQSRLNRDIKASLIANKNVEINMPEFLQETSVQVGFLIHISNCYINRNLYLK